MSIKDSIQAEAQTLGFSLVGISRPVEPPHFPVFQKWLESGRHGQMAYLSRPESLQRRKDPKLILPEAESILSLGILYSSTAHRPDFQQAAQIRGRVAAY